MRQAGDLTNVKEARALGCLLFTLLASEDSERNMVLGDAEEASIDGRFDLIKVAERLRSGGWGKI